MIYKKLNLWMMMMVFQAAISSKIFAVDHLWFQGSLEKAFETARSTNKPLLLYWGAVWCPPCNELKAQVFSHPEFASLTKSMIPVYLDGDTEAAQIWGEKFNATGYPTVILMNPKGDEILRLKTSLTFEEFKDSLQAAISLNEPVQSVISKAINRTKDQSIWNTLAFTHWESALVNSEEAPDMLATHLSLFEASGQQHPTVRAALAAKILDSVPSIADIDKNIRIPETAAKKLSSLLSAIFSQADTMFTARDLLIYKSDKLIPLLKSELSNGRYAELIRNWKAAAKIIETSPKMSLDTRLWAAYVQIRLFRTENGAESKLPESLRSQIKNVALQTAKDAKTDYERHAVISGAAWILRKTDHWTEARILLEQELKSTNTPWYYQSSLASLEEDRGNKQKALYWSSEARKSARGDATKIQWIVTDLTRTIRLAADETDTINTLLTQYYQLALSLPDGFRGRNESRSQSVIRSLGSVPTREKTARIFETYKKLCGDLKNKQSNGCEQHFEALNSDKKKPVL